MRRYAPPQHEQIREPRDLHAKIRLQTISPRIVQTLATLAANVEAIERPGHAVDAGRQDQHIAFEFPSARDHALNRPSFAASCNLTER
jgi:hypothetical protein